MTQCIADGYNKLLAESQQHDALPSSGLSLAWINGWPVAWMD